MRIPSQVREFLVKRYIELKNKSLVAKMFGVSRQTATEWCRRADNFTWVNPFKDKKRKPKKSKITSEIEDFILFLRTVFGWGSGRIQQGLISLPSFMYGDLPLEIRNVKEVRLSRMAINNILKKHKKNGYQCHQKTWKFFRAKEPNELWQLDFKGPVNIQGKKYWFIVCIDDYSRYLLLCVQLDHCPTTTEVTLEIMKMIRRGYKPVKILTDNGPQFWDKWEDFCETHGIFALFAHPYYPQDKGKVERTIRNVAEEFTNLLKKFPQWLNGQVTEFQKWYNECRIHRGINSTPKSLYV
jgi:transposase InsO family protein